MKLTICCPFVARGLGGLERVGVDLANNMAYRGHEVALLFYDDSSPMYPVDKNVILINNLQNFPATVERVGKFSPDVFLAMSSGFLSIYMAKIAYEIGCPLAIHESSMHFRFCGPHWAEKRKITFEEAVLEREAICSRAVRIRHVLGHSISFFPKYLKASVRVFPNPINFVVDKCRNNKVISKEKTIINIGGLKKVKNVLPALQAFSRLSKLYPDWKMKIYGGGFAREKKYQKKIHEYIETNGLESSVMLMGEHKDIQEEYLKADVHIITSLVENFSMAVAEAMVCGVPSIGFYNSYGPSKLIKHEFNGLLVHQQDEADGIERALKRLMDDQELRSYLSRNAANNAKTFSPESIYDKWEIFFDEASSYNGFPDKLLFEHIERDSERALFAHRKSSTLLSQ